MAGTMVATNLPLAPDGDSRHRHLFEDVPQATCQDDPFYKAWYGFVSCSPGRVCSAPVGPRSVQFGWFPGCGLPPPLSRTGRCVADSQLAVGCGHQQGGHTCGGSVSAATRPEAAAPHPPPAATCTTTTKPGSAQPRSFAEPNHITLLTACTAWPWPNATAEENCKSSLTRRTTPKCLIGLSLPALSGV